MGFIIQFAVLWWMITYFTRETNPDIARLKALIVTLTVAAANLIVTLTVGRWIGAWSTLVNLAVLT
ncbi:MAG: hypothetical protein ACQCXQ_00330, partial [Verrucomicrobiales bacterium]